MNIIEVLKQKPWEEEQAAIDNLDDGTVVVLPRSKFALRLFLGSITVVLSLFVIAYSDRMFISDWHPIPEQWLLWLNTATGPR